MMLLLQHVDRRVQDYFAPWLDDTAGAVPILTGTVGVVEPRMARQHFLFHTAIDALCFCHFHPHLLGKPGSNVFTVIGLGPTASQLLELKYRYSNARMVGVFDDDLCGRVLDCKVALWQMGRDASFILDNGMVAFAYRGSACHVPAPRFSLHRFRTLTGMRSTYRTLKPRGFVSFTTMVVHHLNAPCHQT